MSKKEKPRKSAGYIWVGAYIDSGELGWQLPPYMTPNDSEPLSDLQQEILEHADDSYFPGDFYKARIVLTPVKTKDGRYIIRRNKAK